MTKLVDRRRPRGAPRGPRGHCSASTGIEVVGAAGNVAAGLDLVEHADPDVAIVDIRLPDGSGIDLTRELLARRPDLGVILYTGDSDAELLYEGLDSGARGYALKAGSMEELRRRDRAGRRRRLVRRPAPGPHPALAARDRAACRSSRRASARSCT